MAKAKTSKTAKSRKQGQIPGAEEVEIPELTDASEAYQLKIRERLAIQKVEADQKAHLHNVVTRLIEAGRLKLNPNIPDGVEQIVYRYTDDSGNKRTIGIKRADVTIKVHVEKPKDDDE